jgi:hypothetical protein
VEFFALGGIGPGIPIRATVLEIQKEVVRGVFGLLKKHR